jgi:hypothetical protein
VFLLLSVEMQDLVQVDVVRPGKAPAPFLARILDSVYENQDG